MNKGSRAAALAFIIVTVVAAHCTLDSKVDAAHGREITVAEHEHIAERTPGDRIARKLTPRQGWLHRPLAAGAAIYRYTINRRIQATRLRIMASLAQDPDDFDARDRMWQRLHRLQTRRDQLS